MLIRSQKFKREQLVAEERLKLAHTIKDELENQIAQVLNISLSRVRKSRYRLRKKMSLREGEEIAFVLRQL